MVKSQILFVLAFTCFFIIREVESNPVPQFYAYNSALNSALYNYGGYYEVPGHPGSIGYGGPDIFVYLMCGVNCGGRRGRRRR